MKTIAVLISTLALSQAAYAQAPDCRLIAAAAARLACYDKAAPPAASAAPATVSRPVVTAVDQGKYVDAISAEDALMNARLKNICRGC